MNAVEIGIMVMVDADGNWEIGVDADDLTERWTQNVGDPAEIAARRVVKVKVKVPVPAVVELSGEVAAEPAAADGLRLE